MKLTFRERLANERRRLLAGPRFEEKPNGFGTVRFLAKCLGDSDTVTRHAKEVLIQVNEHSTGAWPDDAQWSELLPEWFVTRCAPAQTQEEANKWLAWWKTLSPEEQGRAEQQYVWPLDDWLHWFRAEDRSWFWWDAVVLDQNHIAVAVEVDGWPFPWQSLRWLFRGAGAIDLEPEV